MSVFSLIAFRKTHAALRETQFLTNQNVSWFNSWDSSSRLVSFCLRNQIYIAFNTHFDAIFLELPDGNWRVIINTEEDWIFHANGAPISSIKLAPYSSLLAIRIP